VSVPDVSAQSQSGGDHSRPRGHARVIFIDLARALAAVFMLYGHTVSALLAPRYQTGTWFDIWVFQRGLTSTLFLLLSGFAFSIATGRHWSLHGQISPAVIKRVRRFSLFVVLGYALHFPVARFVDLAYATPESWRSFLAVDVLQLIGATFIGVQLLVMLTRSRRAFGWTALGLAIVAVLTTPWVWSVDWTARLPPSIAAYLSPSGGSQFPLFPWTAYVLIGAALGQWYLKWGTARLDWYANVALFAPGLGLVTLAFVVGWVGGQGAWESVPNQVALRMGVSLMLLALIARASQRINHLPHLFGAVAQETLLIYFVHLCIVYGSVWNTGLAQAYGPTLGPGQTILVVVLLLAAMAGLALYWNWWKHTRPRLARWTAIAAGLVLIYRLL
jgi:acyltransferase